MTPEDLYALANQLTTSDDRLFDQLRPKFEDALHSSDPVVVKTAYDLLFKKGVASGNDETSKKCFKILADSYKHGDITSSRFAVSICQNIESIDLNQLHETLAGGLISLPATRPEDFCYLGLVTTGYARQAYKDKGLPLFLEHKLDHTCMLFLSSALPDMEFDDKVNHGQKAINLIDLSVEFLKGRSTHSLSAVTSYIFENTLSASSDGVHDPFIQSIADTILTDITEAHPLPVTQQLAVMSKSIADSKPDNSTAIKLATLMTANYYHTYQHHKQNTDDAKLLLFQLNDLDGTTVQNTLLEDMQDAELWVMLRRQNVIGHLIKNTDSVTANANLGVVALTQYANSGKELFNHQLNSETGHTAMDAILKNFGVDINGDDVTSLTGTEKAMMIVKLGVQKYKERNQIK